MPKRNALTVVAVALAVALVGGGCGADDQRTDSVTLGAIYPVSGLQGPGGSEEANGARLAVELANDRGGIGGRQVRLELVDVDRADAAAGAVERLHRDGVEVVLGSYGSTISAPAAAAVQREGMLLWETGAVGEVDSDSGAGQSFFRLAPMGANLGRAAVAFVRDQLATKLVATAPLRYAVAYVDDVYGRAVGEGAAEEATTSGQELVGTFPYSLRGFDADAVVRSIAAVHPDVLFVSAYLDDGIALRKATVAQGLKLQASIGTSSSYCMPSFAAALGPAAVGLFASDKPDGRDVRPDALQPEGRDVLSWGRERYRQRHGTDMTPAALSGFANAWALVGHVLPAAGAASARQVADAARTLKLGSGTLPNGAGLDLAGPGTNDAGENRRAVSVIWQWVDPGTQAVVWPPAFATRPIQAIPIQ